MMVPEKEIRLLSLGVFFLLAGSLIASLFFKAGYLWMDEVLSVTLISDSSLAHLNEAIVSGMDANPPLFPNLYWVLGHVGSLNPHFLRAVSVVIFALAMALFYRFTTRLIGSPVLNFVLLTLLVALTYLNLALSTQIRGYSLFLLIACGFFVTLQRLMTAPNRGKWLAMLFLTGSGLVFTHNFGLFYLAASGAFFALFFLWSNDRNYVRVLAVHLGILALWFVLWYPSFAVQAEAGKPHSWIPLPTGLSFFGTVGELAPTISSRLERSGLFFILPILRFGLLIGLFVYIALPRLKAGFRAVIQDNAFLFFLLAGFIYLTTILISLTVSFVHTSVFISRYLWPSHLLVIYQVMYAFYYFFGHRTHSKLTVFLPIYVVLLVGFLFYQNRKIVAFPSGILSDLSRLDGRYPVFVESADYFLPIWFHKKEIPVRYLLDWSTAAREDNSLEATVEYKILNALNEKYGIAPIVPLTNFDKIHFPHFYVVDESSVYQVEAFVAQNKLKVVRTIPVDIVGHRILECTF